MNRETFIPRTECCAASFAIAKSGKGLVCYKCNKPQRGKPAPWPGKNKAVPMLQEIRDAAKKIIVHAERAMLEPNEKKRDAHIVKIMDFTDEIRDQYSSNWY